MNIERKWGRAGSLLSCGGAVTKTKSCFSQDGIAAEVQLFFIRQFVAVSSVSSQRWLPVWENKRPKLCRKALREVPGLRGPPVGRRLYLLPLRSWGKRRSRFWGCPLHWATSPVWEEGELAWQATLLKLASRLDYVCKRDVKWLY